MKNIVFSLLILLLFTGCDSIARENTIELLYFQDYLGYSYDTLRDGMKAEEKDFVLEGDIFKTAHYKKVYTYNDIDFNISFELDRYGNILRYNLYRVVDMPTDNEREHIEIIYNKLINDYGLSNTSLINSNNYVNLRNELLFPDVISESNNSWDLEDSQNSVSLVCRNTEELISIKITVGEKNMRCDVCNVY